MNRSTVAGVSALGNYYKRGRLPPVSQRFPSVSSSASVCLPACLFVCPSGCRTHRTHVAPHDPTQSSRRQAAEDCACLRFLQAPEAEGKSTSHQSHFPSVGPKGIGPFGLIFYPLSVTLQGTDGHATRIHITLAYAHHPKEAPG